MIVETNNSLMGRNISYLRKKKHLSRKELAYLVGINQNTLFCIESQSIRFMNDFQISKLCTLFEITVEELMETEIQ